jgi:N-acetylmuramoyl-L-alanine amidase CwlD
LKNIHEKYKIKEGDVLYNKTKNKFLIVLTIMAFVFVVGKNTFANNNDVEAEFSSVIENYTEENIIVENGLSLDLEETLDLSEYPNWELSNQNTVYIDESGILHAKNEGTVFLSQEFDGKLHVLEIYVSEPKISLFSNINTLKERSRNYYKVFLDPGHGGKDSGATSNGYKEKDLNLQIAFKVKEKLEAKGIEVGMSRTDDTFIELKDRPVLASKYGADIFVSIHQNSASTQATGIETYHAKEKTQEKPLASAIQTNLIKETNANNRGVKSANFVVIKESTMPSALIECGFISTLEEAVNLADLNYQDKLATGIANGIESYLKEYISLNFEEVSETDEVINFGVINADSLNVRSGRGTSYSTIGSLKKGSEVEIYETKDEWHKIDFNGKYGYISEKYVDLYTYIENPLQPENPILFKDINSSWAKNEIISFVQAGYLNGYEDNTFRPSNSITRAEFITIVNKVFDKTKKTEITFSDVADGEWYYDAVCIAVGEGYINGYSDNTFKPNAPITREEAAKIVAIASGIESEGTVSFKDDSSISEWAKQYVVALATNGVINGYEDNTFKPKNNITREETVAILSRVK